MTPTRLRKRIERALKVSWREQPTRYDIEAVQANTRRVGLVIRIRWALLIVLVVYSALAGLAYTASLSIAELAARMFIPAMALVFVVMYNTFYQLNYKRFGNIAVWNNLQLTLDAIVVTVLVYYSGGVSSWFWSMYSLFILEAAFILPTRRGAWFLAVTCMVLLGLIEFLELFQVIPHVVIPFAAADQYLDPVYVLVRYLWQVAVLAGTAAVATQLVGEQRAEAEKRQSLAVLDETTGLYSRSYFLRALAAEVRRAQRDDRPLHVILVDIDRFGVFNQRFGIEAGDELLKLIAGVIKRRVSEVGDVTITTNLAARYGGEEFVVMLAEDDTVDGPPQPADALRLAEQLRRSIGATTLRRCRRDGVHRRRLASRVTVRAPTSCSTRRTRRFRSPSKRAATASRWHPRSRLSARKTSSRTSSTPRTCARWTTDVRRVSTWLVGLALAFFLLGASVALLTIPAFTRIVASRISLADEAGLSRDRMLADRRAGPQLRCRLRWQHAAGDRGRRDGIRRAAVSHLRDVRRVLGCRADPTGLVALGLAVGLAYEVARKRTRPHRGCADGRRGVQRAAGRRMRGGGDLGLRRVLLGVPRAVLRRRNLDVRVRFAAHPDLPRAVLGDRRRGLGRARVDRRGAARGGRMGAAPGLGGRTRRERRRALPRTRLRSRRDKGRGFSKTFTRRHEWAPS